ncbi:amidinotransferase [Pseudoalteromonas sp. MMG013]|uniref:citrulline utilization hydrolase CtlX n=1 Tax=Pseudoalteromonas sp. MMG013 TaxID=2822687 RepID=UPI001B378FB8|nr:arginine deiminase-related protein [Pseudoalteromonas sp. MMG013]MBQ4860649.1 amidinotransferase [Pseudoalteromonas sp. MMG013]
MNKVHAPNAVVMMRPHHFTSNPQTMMDNTFQICIKGRDVAKQAYLEVTRVAEQLMVAGVMVHLFEDESDKTPDSVFPNNWFSTHSNGSVVVYPMYAENRRLEIRQDVLDYLSEHYEVKQTIDYSNRVNREVFLEGTGSMVLDHNNSAAYVVESKRSNRELVEQVCTELAVEPVIFNAYDANKVPVYHTNVVMCVADQFVMVGLDMVPKHQQPRLLAHFRNNNLKVIKLSNTQVNQFCGNAIELQGRNNKILALSQTAFSALSLEQIEVLEEFVELLPIDISTVESAGGSVRCMVAGVHLPRKKFN